MSKLNALSGRWKLGLLLALGTATMWGTLPVALHQVVPTIGPATSTFFSVFYLRPTAHPLSANYPKNYQRA
jgi:drug/metabolite transporter (DMT)-like permease